jgi:uncharacterized membrane-anchored protein YitT (DUF2179 family)
MSNSRRLIWGIPWNLFLLTAGACFFALGIKCIAIPHEFLSSGLMGTGLLIFYSSAFLTPAILYALLNIPVFILGWIMIGRRFLLYTIYGVFINSLAIQFMPWSFPVTDHILAAVATGLLCGIGATLTFKSLGSDGGLSIVSIILNQRYDIKLGTVSLIYNALLFAVSMYYLDIDLVLYSMVSIFVQNSIVDYASRIVNQRKLVYILSPCFTEISADIMNKLRRGCTFVPSVGAYTKVERPMIMTVVYNFQLKRLEEMVYKIDPKAFIIIENTYNVLGKGFSRRKHYS